MIYGIANIIGLLLILARFTIFSGFVNASLDNGANYSNLAFVNSIMPFVFIGISYGQNAVYARFYKKRENLELLGFYNLSFILISIFSIILFVITKTYNLNFIYAFSIIQFSLNFFSHKLLRYIHQVIITEPK